MIVDSKQQFLSAAEVCEALGISASTLYSYVSRGLIRSEKGKDPKKRVKRYRREDVEHLLERKTLRNDPGKASKNMLAWGMPIMESQLTLIENGRLYYKGRDVEELARTCSFEEVAAFLWLGQLTSRLRPPDSGLSEKLERLRRESQQLSYISRYQILLAAASQLDAMAFDLSPSGVTRTAVNILSLATLACADEHTSSPELGIAERLQEQWSLTDPSLLRLIDTALILLAEHELNVTTFAARCAASTRANPYEVVQAGLASLNSQQYLGILNKIDALLKEVGREGALEHVLHARLKRGDDLSGFGHRLYPSGDPRAKILMELMIRTAPEHPTCRLAAQCLSVGSEVFERPPETRLAIVLLNRFLGLPQDNAIMFFAIARTVGWLAHGLEQYEQGREIRPRATYTGTLPS